jgi:hypothetical protein
MAVAEFVCGHCGHEFCPECVVFPFGVKKPPMCIDCGLQMSGVSRRPTGRPRLSRRDIRRRLKDRKQVTATSRPAPSATIPVAEPAKPEAEIHGETPPPFDDDRWLDGLDPGEFPGGWHQRF